MDPYVAVYSPPSPSRTGTITHLRWRGLLSPAFVQLIVDSAMYVLSSSSCSHPFFQWYESNNALSIHSFRSSLSQTADPPSSFISITAHAFSTSPVTYIPPGADSGTGREAPLRVPRNAAEHCWSLILVPGSSTVGGEGKVTVQDNEIRQGSWAMAETVGKWDMRWG